MSLELTVENAYQQIAGFAPPNPMQHQVWEYFNNNQGWGVSLLLKAPTGSGKTEAVGIPALADLSRRLVMVYPTRSLVDDQIERFRKMLARCSAQTGKELTLVVDTGAQAWRCRWHNGQEMPLPNPHRHLYDGNVIITTLDKFLYRFFGFGEPGKSYIFPLRIHYSHQKMLVCFDEAHAYDTVAFTNFARLVKTMYEKGIDVALMTATMPANLSNHFDYLELIDFTDGNNKQLLENFSCTWDQQTIHPYKKLTYIPAAVESSVFPVATDDDPEFDPGMWVDTQENQPPTFSPAITEIVNYAQQKFKENRLIVTVETVRDAVAIFRILKSTLRDEHVYLYHGRLSSEQRKEVYQTISQLDGENKSYLLISTSAIEVGCDLNAHILITQLCDPERLIQRAGRCNRKQKIPNAEVIVIGDTIPTWLTSLDSEGFIVYQQTLQTQNGQMINVEELTRCIGKIFTADQRTEMMFDMLYEYVYQAKLENKPLHERGLLFTRSWEPTITLYTHENNSGKMENAVEVPISRCVAKKGEAITTGWQIFKRTFNRNDRRPEITSMGTWECAYTADLIAQLDCLHDFNKTIGYETLPKLFNYSYRNSYRRVLVRVEEKGKYYVWYLDDVTGTLQSILTNESPAENDTSDESEDSDK